MQRRPYLTLVRDDFPAGNSGDFVPPALMASAHDVAHREVIERHDTCTNLDRMERYAREAHDWLSGEAITEGGERAKELLTLIANTLREELGGAKA